MSTHSGLFQTCSIIIINLRKETKAFNSRFKMNLIFTIPFLIAHCCLHFQQDLMEEKGVSNDLVSEVISLRQLKVEYKQYESKLSLVKRYDIFLADTRIMRLIPKFLGKPFYARKKFPVPINLRADNLKQARDYDLLRVNHTLSKFLRVYFCPIFRQRVTRLCPGFEPGNFSNELDLSLDTMT